MIKYNVKINMDKVIEKAKSTLGILKREGSGIWEIRTRFVPFQGLAREIYFPDTGLIAPIVETEKVTRSE